VIVRAKGRLKWLKNLGCNIRRLLVYITLRTGWGYIRLDKRVGWGIQLVGRANKREGERKKFSVILNQPFSFLARNIRPEKHHAH
jgi:hypothetical protein